MKKSILNFVLFLFFVPFISQGQQALNLASCEIVEYEVNDHSDTDDDGIVCEAKIVLSNSAYYNEDEICQLSNINWIVLVDLDADGINDLEYSSSLPSSDNTLDDTNNNGIPDLYIPTTTNNGTQSIVLPDIEGASSNHNVIWTVSDDCNLGDNCNTSFNISDNKAPTPYCISIGTLVFDGEPFQIHAEDFDVGSFDNCSDQEDLRFSFSGTSIVSTMMITCDEVINSPISINLYCWDESDNADYCTVLLSLVPGPTVDCLEGGGEIAGNVRSWQGEPLAGVEIILNANALEYPISAYTDVNGNYTFGYHENMLNYSLSASFDYDYLNGVSTLDLVIIQRHILGLQPFLNPYQILAADINGDEAIKANDLVSLRKLILGVITEIPGNTSWNFLRADFEFMIPTMPFLMLQNATENPYIYEFNSINNNGGYDFVGIKTGDVSN